MSKTFKNVLVIQNLMFWVGFVFINLYLSFTFFPWKIGLLRFGIIALVNIPVYWLCYDWAIKKFFVESKLWNFFFWLVFIILLSSLARVLLFYPVYHSTDFPDPEMKLNQLSVFGGILVIFTQAVIIAVSSLLGIAKNKIENEGELNTVIYQKTKNELTLLKAKINPHFLLNTLNNIYYYNEKENNKGANAILMLGDLLRYTIYDSAQSRITLEKEIESLKSLTQLYALRFNKEPNITFQVDSVPLADTLIPPSILLILFENALKYSAVGTSDDSYIFIQINKIDGKLHFLLENNIAEEESTLQDIYGGLGLSALRKILELEYPEKFSLTTHRRNHIFTAKLELAYD